MKRILLFTAAITLFQVLSAQNLKPYIKAYSTTNSVSETGISVKESLASNGLEILGQYRPDTKNERLIIIVTSDDLKSAVKKIGGLTGFAGALRVAITEENNNTLVSYTNPQYWGTAYFREDYGKVAGLYESFNNKLKKSFSTNSDFSGVQFGSEKGVSIKDLKDYQYMFGMPDFDDTEELADFDSYNAAIEKVESSIKKGVPNAKLVYRLSIPEKEITLYGVALSGPKGEGQFMPIIDIDTPQHSAFLPYEILVVGHEVHMLQGRFRIALSFPDLTMGTFSKIMSTPGNIEDALEQFVE